MDGWLLVQIFCTQFLRTYKRREFDFFPAKSMLYKVDAHLFWIEKGGATYLDEMPKPSEDFCDKVTWHLSSS